MLSADPDCAEALPWQQVIINAKRNRKGGAIFMKFFYINKDDTKYLKAMLFLFV
jgi:hypothetical protein